MQHVYKRLLPQFVILLMVTTATAGSITPLVEIGPRGERDAYGSSSLIVGNELLVAETSGFSTAGMIHVLHRNDRDSWDVVQTIEASDTMIGNGFGTVMTASNGRLAVVAPGARDGDGAVYIFEKTASGRWSEVAVISGSGNRFGASLAITGSLVFVGIPMADEGAGAVQVFDGNNGWKRIRTLTPESPGERAQFGASISAANGMLAVGVPGFNSGRGRIDIFRADSGGDRIATISNSDGEEGDRAGNSLAFIGERLFDGNPRAGDGAGVVTIYTYSRNGASWKETRTLMSTDPGDGPKFFGTAIAASQDEIWISAPLARDFAGEVYRYDASDLDLLGTIGHEGNGGRSQFGASIAVSDAFAVVGMPAEDYGLGSAVVFERTPGNDWEELSTYNGPGKDLPAITGDEIECQEGASDGNPCQNVDLVSFIPLRDLKMNRGVRLNDVWGWTDPDTGKEYGIIGHMEAAVFVDLSTPTNPVVLGELPRTDGSPGSTWRDMKVYKNHAFIVADGAGDHGMQVFDLTHLRDWPGTFQRYEPDVLYTGIASAHNIIINEDTGYAYTVGNSSGGETCGGGLHMINIQDPKNPTFVGCFNDPETDNGRGATHDAQCVTYHGPDDAYRGHEVCVGSNGNAISIADVTDKDHPVPVSQGRYPNSSYVHQGWFTEDHRYFYQNDETDETNGIVDRTRTMIWDLIDLDEPEMIAEYYGDSNSTDHNLFVKGDFMYQTNNASGLRVIDISDRAHPEEVGYFDTTPDNRNVAGFDGTWSSFPYFDSGLILLTSRREGLFVVRKSKVDI